MGEYTLVVNTLSFTERKRVRKNFGKLKEVSKFPNLIEIQKKSYEEFLLEEIHPSKRPDRGLQKVFKSVFPLSRVRCVLRLVIRYVSSRVRVLCCSYVVHGGLADDVICGASM